jgi:RimJ/RimL family protein N-acetyltransferase
MAATTNLENHWPLRVTTPRLELRIGRDDDFPAVLDLIDEGIHDPAVMPFDVPWTDAPRHERDLRTLQFWWTTRANQSPDAWSLDLFVFVDGQPIGAQSIAANNFPTLREAKTGSWLGKRFQRHGYGTEMRAAVLYLGFETIGATAMLSGAFADNTASRSVSSKLGYEFDGIVTKAPRGQAVASHRFRLSRERWLAHRHDIDVQVTGFDACRPMLGL